MSGSANLECPFYLVSSDTTLKRIFKITFQIKLFSPQDLSPENQEHILRRAEREMQKGRISHSDHQEIVRQLGQVYDSQRKRYIRDEFLSRSLDMRDPRLRGIKESRGPPYGGPEGDAMGPYREEFDDRRKIKGPILPDRSRPMESPEEQEQRSPRFGRQDRGEDFRSGYPGSPREKFDRRAPPRPDYRGNQPYPRDYDMDEHGSSPRDFDRPPQRFRSFPPGSDPDLGDHDDRSPRDFDGRGRGGPYSEYERRHLDRNRDLGRREEAYDKFPEGRPGRAFPQPSHDMRGHLGDSVELDRRRRMSPPEIGPYRGPVEGTQNMPPRLPFGPNGPPHHQGQPDLVRGPQQPPENREQVPSNGPMGMRPRPSLPPVSQKSSTVSDPMADPRWAPMMGLLDSSGTEEVVIDGKPFELRMGTSRKLRIHGMIMDVAVDLKERGIRINSQLVYKLGEPIKEVPVADRTVRLYYHGLPKPIWLDGQQHEMRLDAPPRNVMVDNVRHGFQIDGRDMMILVDRLEKGQYGGPPRKIRIVGVDHEIAFQAPPRRILIDGKSCELKLDTKIPYVIINGKPHGIRFDGEPRTVFINDQPFTIPVDRAERIKIGQRPTYIAFGGPAHELIIDGKWFEVKFDNVSKDIHLGNRHFLIRLPGPLPRVKILQELPLKVDDSRLLMSNKVNAQPNEPPQFFPNQPAPQPAASLPLPGAVAPNQEAHIPDGAPNMTPGVSEEMRPPGIPNNIRPSLPISAQGPNLSPGQLEGPRLPGQSAAPANLPPQGLATAAPCSESGQHSGQASISGAPVAPVIPVQGVSMPPITGNMQVPGMQGLATSLPGPGENRLPGPVVQPSGNPGFQGMPPRIGQLGGMAFRPAGEGMINPGFLLSGTQPVMTQPPPMLIQSGPLRQPNQPPIAFQRPGMLGMRQSNNPPVNILAQGFLNRKNVFILLLRSLTLLVKTTQGLVYLFVKTLNTLFLF